MSKPYAWSLLVFLLAGCTAVASGDSGQPERENATQPDISHAAGEAAAEEVQEPLVPALLDDFGPAPELTNQVWLNTGQALRLADLRGKVVLLDMWTFG